MNQITFEIILTYESRFVISYKNQLSHRLHTFNPGICMTAPFYMKLRFPMKYIFLMKFSYHMNKILV